MHEVRVYTCIYYTCMHALSCISGLTGIHFCVGQVVQSTGGSAFNPSPVKPTAQVHNNGYSTEIAGIHKTKILNSFISISHFILLLGNSAETVTSITSTVEYRTIVSCTTKLMAAVCNDLVRLSGCLFEKGLISQENASGLRNRHVEEADRAAHLVDLVQQKVKLDSRNYVQFTSILEEDEHHYSDILRILKEAYSSLMQSKYTYMHVHVDCYR